MKLVFALILTFFLISPVYADNSKIYLNVTTHLAALVRTDRAPRSWKTLWLKPGRYTYYYYEWLMPDGTFAVQGTPNPFPNVPDRRPLSDSHPNVAFILAPIQFVGFSTAMGLTASKL
jgi:hypothetical protein